VSTDETGDLALIEKAKAGDGKAMEALLSKYEQRVYRYGLRMCGHEEDARDVLQETLLAAFKNLGSFRGDAQLSTWLFQIARSFCTRQRRRKEGAPPQLESLDKPEAKEVASEESASDARAHARSVGEVIQAAIHTLPEDYREAIVLRDIEGLSTEEAAKVAGVEEAALKSRLHRARMGLKERLAAVLDEQPAEALGCAELSQELSEYAGSDIDQAACARIEAHLERCAKCTAACDALKRTVSMCRAIPGGDVPAPVKAAVRRALSMSAV
jgi:RNA polymerase sigma-70 factor (ECF subfamily)